MNELNNLLPDTRSVIEKLASLPLLQNFTFVGGSALTVYFRHRYSEDIDLFTWHNELNSIEIEQTLQQSGYTQVRITDLSARQADFVVEGVKVSFFANGWNELQNRTNIADNLYIATLETLAVMKVNTLFMRAKFRDYYDLYVLSLNGFSVAKLYELAGEKMKNLDTSLFQKALVFTKDIDDESIAHLQPQYQITLKQIEKHFVSEIKKWNKAMR